MRQGVFTNSWLKTIWDLIYRAITAMISNYYRLSIYHPLAEDLGKTVKKLSTPVLVHFTNTLAYFQCLCCSFVSIARVCQVCSFKWDTATAEADGKFMAYLDSFRLLKIMLSSFFAQFAGRKVLDIISVFTLNEIIQQIASLYKCFKSSIKSYSMSEFLAAFVRAKPRSAKAWARMTEKQDI